MGQPGITDLRAAGDPAARPAASHRHDIANLHTHLHHQCQTLDHGYRTARRDDHDGFVNDRNHHVNRRVHHVNRRVDHHVQTTEHDSRAGTVDHAHQSSRSPDQRDPDAVPAAVALSFSALSMTWPRMFSCRSNSRILLSRSLSSSLAAAMVDCSDSLSDRVA